MDISALLQATVSPIQKQLPTDLSDLKSGLKSNLTVTGRVIQADLDGKVLIDFGNFRAAAKIAIPVEKGQVLDFVLEKKGDQLAVKVILPDNREAPVSNVSNTSKTALPSQIAPQLTEVQTQASQAVRHFEILPDKVYKELLADIKTLLSKNTIQPEGQKFPPNIQHSLEKITTFFKPMPVGQDIFNQVSQLKSFVEDSGIFFEKKIEDVITQLARTSEKVSTGDIGTSTDIKHILSKDLKPNLLILKNYLSDPEVMDKIIDPKGLQRIQSSVEQLLSNVHQQQEVSTNRPNDPDMLQVFSYTLPFQDSEQKSRIKVYYPKKKVGQKAGSHRVSLLLDMDRLGTVRADLVPVNKDLNITFFVKNEDTRQLIEANYDELTDALVTTFDHFYINAMVSDKKIERFDTEDFGPTSNRQIDIKA